MKSKKSPEEFYSKLLDILLEKNIPFMIGRTYAITAYTGIKRPTKDMDIISTVEDFPRILKTFSDIGYHTEILDENWIAKVREGNYYTDIIYAEKNGLEKVDRSWLARAGQGEVFGHIVKLVPIEEMINSKAFIQNKERFDGSDVINLTLRYGKTINWKLLKEKMDPNWEILFAHLINFVFVYPNDIHYIPTWIIEEYIQRLQKKFTQKPDEKDKVTRGLLISSQYRVAVEKWGYRPISPFLGTKYEQRDEE